MRALLQRVSRARVTVDGKCVGEIGPGLLVLLGIHRTDTAHEAAWLARKVASLRVFPDPEGKMNLSVQENGRHLLIVSQFTLYGDTRKGNRPSYLEAAPPDRAKPLYESFVEHCRQLPGITVETGVFQAHMEVQLVNDGPVTVLCQTEGTAHLDEQV
jgi:D-tyrosyl-tRNA(Tyr) deacylase